MHWRFSSGCLLDVNEGSDDPNTISVSVRGSSGVSLYGWDDGSDSFSLVNAIAIIGLLPPDGCPQPNIGPGDAKLINLDLTTGL